MKKVLDLPITDTKLQEVITNLKNIKTPSPDGYGNEVYITFKDLISPLYYRHTNVY